MFSTLGRRTYRRRRWVLGIAGVFVVVALAWGTGVFGALVGGGFEDPGSESARAQERAADALGRSDADVVVLYSSPDLTVDDPAYRQAVEDHLAPLPTEQVVASTTYWTAGLDALVSGDRRSTYAVLQLAGADEDEMIATYDAISAELERAPPGPADIDVQVGGDIPLTEDVSTQVERDIARAEMISMPLLLVLLVIVFGGLVAASLPLAVGALAILGAFTMLHALTLITDISVFAINMVTMLGLGLAIDYALFVVSRFREELPSEPSSADVEQALVRTMATAGRTVAFSGVTVAIALAGLLLFPQTFLRSMGLGGIAAVVVAMTAALTVLPALLAILGRRVDSLRIPFLGRRRAKTAAEAPQEQGAWYRLAHSVMRRPLVYVAVIVPLLLLLGSPFLRVQFGGVDYRALPDGIQSREVAEGLIEDFPGAGTSSIDAVVAFASPVAEPATAASLASYVAELEGVSGLDDVRVTGAADRTARVSVSAAASETGQEAQTLVDDVRAVPAPDGSSVLVGGRSAEFVDLLDSLGRTLPWTALFVVGVTLVLLFLAFGSVVLPIKAVLMNVLSLTASFGVVVWAFQDGNLAGVLGFTETGTVEATQPILMLAIAFGLSMDYEVFLLSRIREQWDRTHDNTYAVASGLQRTGRIITSAALLLAVVIGAFSTSGITFITMIGVGLLVAIVVDATVVRALLVPATMRLLGRANWWAPAPLARWWERHGIREVSELPQQPTLPRPRPEPREPLRASQ